MSVDPYGEIVWFCWATKLKSFSSIETNNWIILCWNSEFISLLVRSFHYRYLTIKRKFKLLLARTTRIFRASFVNSWTILQHEFLRSKYWHSEYITTSVDTRFPTKIYTTLNNRFPPEILAISHFLPIVDRHKWGCVSFHSAHSNTPTYLKLSMCIGWNTIREANRSLQNTSLVNVKKRWIHWGHRYWWIFFSNVNIY